jgi:hypothetical protein
MSPIVQIILQTTLDALLIIAAMAKTYANEKAKNLATKEDIAEITRQVEEVKNNLQFKNQLKLSLRTEEKKAIVDCYEKAHLLKNKATLNYFGFGTDNYDEIDQIIFTLNASYDEYLLVEAKMLLYVQSSKENQGLVDKLKEASDAIFHQYRKTGELTLKYKRYLFDYKRALDAAKASGELNTRELRDEFFDKWKGKMGVLVDDHNAELRPLIKASSEKMTQFQHACYQHLTEMEESK